MRAAHHDGAAVAHQRVWRRIRAQRLLELAGRLVKLRLGVDIGGGLLDVADHAHHRHPGQRRGLHPNVEALADGVLPRPVMFRQRAVHDHHKWRIDAIRIREAAPPNQRNPQRLEVIAQDLRRPAQLQLRALRRVIAFGDETAVAVIARRGQVRSEPDRLHAGQLPEFRQQLAVE